MKCWEVKTWGSMVGSGPLYLCVQGPGLEVTRQRSLAFTSYHGPHLPGSLCHHPSLGISGLRCPAFLWFLSNLASLPAQISGALCSIQGRLTANCPLPSGQPCQGPRPLLPLLVQISLNKNQATPSDKGSCMVYFWEERAIRASFSGPWPGCSTDLQTLPLLCPHLSSIDPR